MFEMPKEKIIRCAQNKQAKFKKNHKNVLNIKKDSFLTLRDRETKYVCTLLADRPKIQNICYEFRV